MTSPRSFHLYYLIAGAALLATAIVHAEPTPTTDAAPLPGNESGRLDHEPGDSSARKLARGALLLPKLAVTVAFSPFEGAAYAFERYQLADRANRLFFNDAGTIGLMPTLKLESGFGINVGARFVHRDVFGAKEHYSLRASTGGRFHERATTSFSTGERLGKDTALELGGEFERRPKDRFYGLGAMEADLDVYARYRHRMARVTSAFDRRIAGGLHVRAAGQLADHTFDESDSGAPITEVFAMDRLVGFEGVRNGYGEVELRYDTRRRASEWDPATIPATGWLLAGFAGRSTALDDGADFWRYGVDVQRFISFGRGPRVLGLRARGEGVTGELSEVPFIELPQIGGGTTLRGYEVDRFRDRIAVSGSAEYQWDLGRHVSTSVFVDVGTVSDSVRSLDDNDLRLGYGLALNLATPRTFIGRATLASSIDGGVFFNVSLDPVFELEGRTERR